MDGQSSEEAWGPMTQPPCVPHIVAQEVGMTYSHTGARGRAGARVQVLPLLIGNSQAETHWAMAQPGGRGCFHCEWSIPSQGHKTWPCHRMGHEARARLTLQGVLLYQSSKLVRQGSQHI